MPTVPAQALPPPESPMEEKDKITGEETMLEYADIQGESGDVVHTVDGLSWTQEEERAIVKRYDWNIVTIVFTLFMQVLFQSAFFATVSVLILLASYRAGFRSSTVPVRCISCHSEGSPDTDSRKFRRHRQFVAFVKVAPIPPSSTHRSSPTQMRTRPVCPSISA